MKKILIQILILVSILGCILGCKNKLVKEVSPTVNYFENFKIEKKIFDTLKIGGIPKEYNFEFFVNTQNDSTRVFDFTHAILFDMFYVDGKNHFIPTWIITSGFSSIYFYNNLREIIVTKDENENIKFEIEICLQFVEEKDMRNHEVSNQIGPKIVQAIQKINDSKTLKKITVSSDENLTLYKETNSLICRRFKFLKQGRSLITKNINNRKEIVPEKLIKHGIIEITESGDMLDTLILDQNIWIKKGQTYLEK
jgi:hypothetical protein